MPAILFANHRGNFAMQKLEAPELPDWLSAQLPFARYRLRLGKHYVHVMELGRGRPVLMQHGNPTWGFLYRKIAKRLQDQNLRLIMPDLLGFGLSDKPINPKIHTLKSHAERTRLLIEILDLRDLIFVGQDWGGPIGLRALADIPERLAGMVIMNTAVGPPSKRFRPTWFHRFSHTPIISDLAFRLLEFPQRRLAMVQGDPTSISGLVTKAYRLPLGNPLTNVGPLAMARAVPHSWSHPSIPEFQKIEAFVREFSAKDKPRAIVWGEKDPILGRLLKRTRKIMNNPPTKLTFAGHFVQEEVPDVVAESVLDVHRRCPDYTQSTEIE